MNNKPPVLPVATAAETLLAELEALGLGTRVERSNASNSSVYVYAFQGDGSPEVKVRVSNHRQGKGAWRHRAPDIDLVVPGGRVRHAVEQVKAKLRQQVRA